MTRSSSVHSQLKRVVQALLLMASIAGTQAILANPEGGVVASGDATITQTPGSTQINQTSDKTIINWESFNIGANEATHFQQPSSNSIALNRINPGQGASQIYGQLTANGRVILVNQAGVFFGPSASVNVGGLIASTSNISDQNFMAGHYVFDQPSGFNGSVINQGTIIAAEHGLVALVGTAVSNEGNIQAHLGNVVLASGNKFTVDLSGDQLINFSIDEQANSAGVDAQGQALRDGVRNIGSVIADGGTIIMSAKAAQGVLDNVINMSGVAQAQSVVENNGEIILLGGDEGVVKVAGDMDVSGQGVKGGEVKIAGKQILIAQGADINAQGQSGGQVLIGGDYKGSKITGDFIPTDMQNASAVVIMPDAVIRADGIGQGDGGRVIVWSDDLTKFNGSISARGGDQSGNGGFVETSSKNNLEVYTGQVDASSPHGIAGRWLLDPRNVTIQNASTSGGGFSSGVFTPTSDNAVASTTTIQNTLNGGTDVEINTGSTGAQAGNITVADSVTWTTANQFYLNAANNIIINAPITGTNGTLKLSAVFAAQSITTGASGTINVKDFNITQGQWYQLTGSLPAFTVTGNFLLQPTTSPSNAYIDQNVVTFTRFLSGDGSNLTPYVISDIFGLQGAATLSMNNAYKLNNDIDASVTANWIREAGQAGFVPIGTPGFFGGLTGAYFGPDSLPTDVAFDGQNHVIKNLYINKTTYEGDGTTSFIGLFGTTAGSQGFIQNVGLENINYIGGGFMGAIVGGSNSTGMTIKNSYATGSITLNQISGANSGNAGASGGLVGYSRMNLTDVYSNVSVNQAVGDSGTAGTDVGGLVGTLASSTITRGFSTGAVTLLNGSTSVGLIGENGGGSVSNSFWDTEASGQSSSPLGTGKTTAQLKQQSTYTGYTFDASNWGIIESTSYAYLSPFFASTPRVISGTSGLAGHIAVSLAADGSSVTSTYTGNNGSFYALIKNGTIANGANILGYIDSGSTKGNFIVLAPSSGGSVTDLSFTANTILVGNSSTSSYSNASLATAIGSLSDTDILYSASGNNITLGNATNTTGHLTTSGTTTYAANGTIGVTGGGTANLSFGGPVTINTSSITSAGTQTYNGAVTLSADSTLDAGSSAISFLSSINGAQALTLNSTGTTTLAGIIGGSTPLTNLTTNAGGSTVVGANITTSGTQTYNDLFTLNTSPTLTITSGTIAFNGGISGAGTLTTLANGSTTNTLQLPNTGNTTVTITGAGQGSTNFPINFNGFSSIVGQGNTTVVFNVPATLNTSSNTAVINGSQMQFSGVTSYNGSTIPSTVSISAVISQATSTNLEVNDTSSPEAVSTVLLSAFSATSVVNQNVDTILQDQLTLDIEQRENQKFGCI